jgi:biofilm PGA synthesis N-glycosyltransferase PgaC
MRATATAVFLSVSALLVYILAGYPLLLGWMARRFGKPVRKRDEPRTISILIAVRNGADFLAAKLESVLNLRYPSELMEVLVLSDGSTDDTEEIARRYGQRGVRLLCLPRRGKAAAINEGVARSSGEIIVLTDVRQELEPESVGRLVACFADPSIGVVSGDLLIRRGARLEERTVSFYWRYERWIRARLGRLDSTLGATGPFYAVRRELVVHIPEDTLLDDVYLPLAAFFRGYRLIVEEAARAFDYPTALKTEFGRKVRTLAGNYQILRLYPGLVWFGNRMLFHFLSYKLARLGLPYLAILLLISSLGLPAPWAAAAVGAQVLFYSLAAIDIWIPEAAAVKRLTSPARAFVVMMAAAVCALAVFFVPPQRLWKPTEVEL